MAKILSQPVHIVDVREEHVPEWRQYHARAIARGYANNRLYEEGDEFVIVLDAATKTPAKWLETLDEGKPVDGPTNLNANDFAKAETPKQGSGFARGF